MKRHREGSGDWSEGKMRCEKAQGQVSPQSKTPSTAFQISPKSCWQVRPHTTVTLRTKDPVPQQITNYRGEGWGIRLVINLFFNQPISVHRPYFKPTFFLKKRRQCRGNLNTDKLFYIKNYYLCYQYPGHVFCKQNPHLLSLIIECLHIK